MEDNTLSLIDSNIIFQSFPSIIISMFGMFFTSLIFKEAIEHKNLENFPFILLSSTILSFKGNIELGYVMYLSVLRPKTQMSIFKKIIIGNTCFIIIQSFLVGIFSGILCIICLYIKKSLPIEFYMAIVLSGVSTCLLTTVVFAIVFILCMEMSLYLSIDQENFIMPILNTVNDVVVVKILLMLSLFMIKLSLNDCILILLIEIIFIVLCCIFIRFSEDLLPFQNSQTILFVTSLNIITGFFLEKLTETHPSIAPSFPVFAGLSASISYVFLHKSFSLLDTEQIPPSSTYISLILISFFASSIYILSAYFLKMEFSIFFSVSFIVMFLIQVFLLIKIIDLMVKLMEKEKKCISSNIVPMISSISDFIGAVILIFISVLIKLKVK